MICEWVEEDKEEIESMGTENLADRILEDTDQYLAGLQSKAKSFFGSYMDMLAETRVHNKR
jgi:hypothetical protein